ncbi:hypothetical protein [Cryobacterium sp. PH31-O1]|uniref:hypothetical protein n=1 Tax=Cryobacterium sp. PH31-O1 TaxID=3046306 RepID=UPI0024BBD919|nr:hypothetical protein [Cryobacterium sp. PH31-O1]MDJ0338676.1 hypothetical protein [Cryobacterium sp. PH31-O1]
MRGATWAAAHDFNMKPRPAVLYAYAIATSRDELIFYALHVDGSASASVRAGAAWEPCTGAFFEIGSSAIVAFERGSFIGENVLENAVRILGPQQRAAS